MQIARQPVIYEINTAVFLAELTKQKGRKISLATVPDKVWDNLAALHINTVWLMGVWQRSPLAQTLAHNDPSLKKTLSNLQEEDILGSAYSIHEYVVDERFGGPKGLAKARSKLASRGIALLLDYVPNHVALDHRWTTTNPEYFILGSEAELQKDPGAFDKRPAGIVAKGKDPNYEPWSDVAQLHATSPALRDATIDILKSISDQCDGVRCDMAMLMMNEVFAQTWGKRVGHVPKEDFWPTIIPAVRKHSPDFTFIAEVYWGFDKKLLDQGFDYCYDKNLYDALAQGSTKSLRQLLDAGAIDQRHKLRFIENHDEPRAAGIFHRARHEAAAVILATTLGAKLYHHGQFEGMQVKLPVHLSRKPPEIEDHKLHTFYVALLSIVGKMGMITSWQRCRFTRWLIFPSTKVLAWNLVAETHTYVIIVNYSRKRAKGRLALADGVTGRFGQAVLSSKRRLAQEAAILQGETINLAPWEFAIIRLD